MWLSATPGCDCDSTMDPRLHKLFLDHKKKDVDVSALTRELDWTSLADREDVDDEIFPRKNTQAFRDEQELVKSVACGLFFKNPMEKLSHKINLGTLDVILEVLKDDTCDPKVWSLMKYAIDWYNFNLDEVLHAMEPFLTLPHLDREDMWYVRITIVEKLRTEVKIKEFKLAKQYLYEFPNNRHIWFHLNGVANMLGDQVMLDELKFACDVIELDPQNPFAWELRHNMIHSIGINRECLMKKEMRFLDQMMSEDPSNTFAWSYRSCIALLMSNDIRGNMEPWETKLSSIQEIYSKELKFVKSILLKSMENGDAWAYRNEIVTCEKVCNIEEELDLVNRIVLNDQNNKFAWSWRRYVFECTKKMPTNREFDFVNHFLIENDEKNQCAWNHKQWLLLKFGRWEDEIKFCSGLLLKDVTNEYAWCQKRLVLENCETRESFKKIMGEEVDFAIWSILKEPDSEYPWLYLRELYQKTESVFDDAAMDSVLETILSNEVESEFPSNEVIINALGTILNFKSKHYEASQRIRELIRVLCCRLLCLDVEDYDASSEADRFWNDTSPLFQFMDPDYDSVWEEQLKILAAPISSA
ncbi:Protein farnesyltransferase/geranylgeranyltransferase type-1 subunit alpha [Striga hermonthica]|uniref:Protein farnesyltransferase/geranylgeranyltransferase type-1 subunit alpha n=1 Tax=Striga hermonthica TaxID=68872 RepID=A0A9N7R8J2_STRHE|nr:Protein farnesyltransferase/geranylgeranyltransferase type-1 subunit alpha [Striga hermonthica]